MPEISLNREPAQTYQLNVLASALGRFAASDISRESAVQASELCEQVVGCILDDDKPFVPHTNRNLLSEAEEFDSKLLYMLTKGPAVEYMSRIALDATLTIVHRHLDACQQLRGKSGDAQMLVSPGAIASSYGLPDLWDNASDVIKSEMQRWAAYESHPHIGSDLAKKVELGETRDLMRLMWRHVIEAPHYPEVDVYLTDKPGIYHVYWAPMADRLDYATPKDYDLATQLSFDLPHNATHLAHLDAVDAGLGVFRYVDDMEARAYFEAITVFSEYKALKQAELSPEFIDELCDVIQPKEMSREELASWIVQDRGYEFKLRAARYAADIFMINGISFEETIHDISRLFNIPLADAEKEIRKYLPWTGLGAVYSFGYRKLQEIGIENVYEAITDSNGNAVRSWSERLRVVERKNCD